MVKRVVEGPSPLQTNLLNRNEINKSRACTNRKCSIMKKTRELSILCGITACTVIVGPNGKVDTWPENPADVKSIIDRYKERMGKKSPQPSEFTGKKINLDEFLSGWKDDWLCGLSSEVLGTFLSDLESKLLAMEYRIEVLNVMNYEQRNPQQGKSIVSLNDYAQLGPLQEVHSTASGWFYYPLNVQPLNYYRPSDQSVEECDDCTRQFFPTAAIDSQPLLLDEGLIGSEVMNPVQSVAPPVVEGSLNGYENLDPVDENTSSYCRKFFPPQGLKFYLQ